MGLIISIYNNWLVMQPFHEATKHAELMDFAGRKCVVKLSICRQRDMSLRNQITSLHGTTAIEMLLGDIRS